MPESRPSREGNALDASFAGTRRWRLTRALEATAEQRLAWLEEMIDIARQAGARRRETDREIGASWLQQRRG